MKREENEVEFVGGGLLKSLKLRNGRWKMFFEGFLLSVDKLMENSGNLLRRAADKRNKNWI